VLTKVVKVGGRSRDAAEKPFWISYADLMTALMVLFLVAMSVALLAVTKKISEQERRKQAHDSAIMELLDRLEVVASKFPGVKLDRDRKVIDFQERVLFEKNEYHLRDEQAQLLRAFVPDVLTIAATDLGKEVLKRVVIEGFADQTGTYLYNLNLSLQRSQGVLCGLFAKPSISEAALTGDQLGQIRDLFVVGGYAFNNARKTAAESRRVELRLELYGVDEEHLPAPVAPPENFGDCQLR
jgi:outer membrane protein OmpA-like peptidoglycan-associated protein